MGYRILARFQFGRHKIPIRSFVFVAFWHKQIDLWIPGVSPSTKILLIFAFEHVVLGAKYLVHISTKAPKDKDADAALEREASSE